MLNKPNSDGLNGAERLNGLNDWNRSSKEKEGSR
jgi:hypothetical protein